LAIPIVLIPYLFRLADAINFRKDYFSPLVHHLDPTVREGERRGKWGPYYVSALFSEGSARGCTAMVVVGPRVWTLSGKQSMRERWGMG
jgi:hypothetical protein